MKKITKPAVAAVLSLTLCLSSVQVFGGNSKYFSDVNDESYGWASDYVDILASKKIATGVGDNKFLPEANMERGDFIILLDKTFEFSKASDALFNMVDVNEDMYYYQSIVNAKFAKVIKEQFNFYPEEYITRLDAIKYIYNALSEQNLISGNNTTDVSMYSDQDELLNTTDKIAVGTLTKLGILTGSDDGMLHPNSTMTRAEMAVMMAKTVSIVEMGKAAQAAKAAEEKKAKEEAAKATESTEEENKNVQSISSGNIDESKVIDSGMSTNIKSVTMRILNQESDALTIANGSQVGINKSTIESTGYAAVALKDNSKVSIDDTSIRVSKGNAISDEEGGSEINIEDSRITVDDKGSAISVSAGSTVNIDSSTVTMPENNTYNTVFNLVSTPENSQKAVKFNFKNFEFDNPKTYLFHFSETLAEIVFEDSIINVGRFIDAAYDRKNLQQNGNDITVVLKNTNAYGDIYLEPNTGLTLDIQNGSYFKGSIDKDLYSQDLNIKLSYDGKLELTGDLYVRGFQTEDGYFNNIIDNGHNIYYDDTAEENSYLYTDEFDLPYGGRIMPK